MQLAWPAGLLIGLGALALGLLIGSRATRRGARGVRQVRARRLTWMLRRESGFFLGLGLLYLLILIMLLVARWRQWPFIEAIPDPIGGIIPLAVPWFGALGAVCISLYGVFEHTQRRRWDRGWNYWHLGRPVMGAVLATVAFLIFVGVINATGSEPKLDGPAQDLIPYFVLAFLVGYREATFRDLIKRATDLLLSPGGAGTAAAPAGLSVTPQTLEFGSVAVNGQSELAVTLTNTGTADLTMADDAVAVEGAGFEIPVDSVSGTTLASGTEASLTILFRPVEARAYRGKLNLQTGTGRVSVELLGEGQ